MGIFNYTNSPLTEDWINHFVKINDNCSIPSAWEGCENYPAFYHSFISFLNIKLTENSFILWNLFLFLIFIPALLYFATKSEQFYYLYFIGLSFPYFTLNYGVFPSAIALVLWFIYYIKKNKILKGSILLISPFVHNSLFPLIIITLILELIEHFKIIEKLKLKSDLFFSGFLIGNITSIPSYLNFFFTSLFPVISILGLKQIIQDFDVKALVLIIISITHSVTFSRAILVSVFILLWACVKYFEKNPNLNKNTLYFTSLIFFIMQVVILLR